MKALGFAARWTPDDPDGTIKLDVRLVRDHLVRGYSVNAKRLQELRQSLKLVGQVLERYDVTSDQARALLQVVTDYAFTLDLLDDYELHSRFETGVNKPAISGKMKMSDRGSHERKQSSLKERTSG